MRAEGEGQSAGKVRKKSGGGGGGGAGVEGGEWGGGSRERGLLTLALVER